MKLQKIDLIHIFVYMETFVVSALKYRPKSFSEVIGQESITKTLENSIKTNQLAQALLFCGPRGVGKTSCARILANLINDNNNSSDDFSFNVFELDAASNNSVEDIRNINEQVRIPPQIGSHKVYIIDEAHMLSSSAFNAFLKTLEEPPKHAIFILATTEKNKIIPTVLSRCQIYDFNRISIKDIQLYLSKIAKKNKLSFQENAMFLIAQKADGALRDALSIFDRMVNFTNGNLTEIAVAKNLNLLDQKTYSEIGKLIFNNDIYQLLKKYDELIQRGINDSQFLKGLGNYFRNLMFAKDKKTLHLLEVSETVRTSYLNDTEKISTNYLIDAITLVNNCDIHIKKVSDRRVHIELTLMQLASLHFDGEKKNYIIPASKTKKYFSDSESNSSDKKLSNAILKIDDNLSSSKEKKDVNNKSKTNHNSFSSNDFNLNDKVKNELKKRNINPLEPVSSFSLSSIALKKAISKTIEPNKKNVELEENFNIEAVNKDLNQYVENLKNEGKKNIASILSMNPISLSDNYKIHFKVANEMNRVEVNIEKERLLPFLKKRLKNDKIKIEVEISENPKQEQIYTPTEKYQYLLQLNPQLEELRKKFNLDF